MSKFKFLIKSSISLALICVIFLNVDFGQVAEIMARIDPLFLVILLLITLPMIIVSCLKWQLFLRKRSNNIPLFSLVLYYIIGYFFNNLLPSNIGGDMARSYLLGKDIKNQAKSFGSVFLERITGFIALLAVGIIALLLNPGLMHNISIVISFGGMAIILMCIIAFCFFERLKETLVGFIFPRFGFLEKFKKKFENFYNEVRIFKHERTILRSALIYSFAFHLMTILNTLVCAWAIGVFPNILALAAIVPIAMLISAIPISIGSLGLWEGSFVLFLSTIGVSPAQAISIALILRAKNIFLGMLGGLIYAARGKYLLRAHSS